MDGKVKFGIGLGTENASAEPESIDAASNPMDATPNALPLGLALGSGLAFGSALDFASGLALASRAASAFSFLVCFCVSWAGMGGVGGSDPVREVSEHTGDVGDITL